jgi:hypothetical protein
MAWPARQFSPLHQSSERTVKEHAETAVRSALLRRDAAARLGLNFAEAFAQRLTLGVDQRRRSRTGDRVGTLARRVEIWSRGRGIGSAWCRG